MEDQYINHLIKEDRLDHLGPLQVFMTVGGIPLTIICTTLDDILYFSMTGNSFEFTTGKSLVEVWATRGVDDRIELSFMERIDIDGDTTLREIDIFKYLNMLN